MTTTLLHVAERTPPSFAAPIGTLRATAAWYRGELDTAARAVAEVLAVRPFYSMAQLLTLALRCNVPPEKLQVRMPTAAEIDLVMGPPRPKWLQHLQRSLTGLPRPRRAGDGLTGAGGSKIRPLRRGGSVGDKWIWLKSGL